MVSWLEIAYIIIFHVTVPPQAKELLYQNLH